MIGGLDTSTWSRMKCGQFHCAHCLTWHFEEKKDQYLCASCEEEQRVRDQAFLQAQAEKGRDPKGEVKP